MKIGELSERTGIPTRMLRYYEQQGLIAPMRSANGYRSYAERDVERAIQVRGLVQSGLSTRLTKLVLDAADVCSRQEVVECSVDVADELADELAAIESRISCLTRSRDTVRDFLCRSNNKERLLPAAASASAS
ncbi:MerR family DNA-binding transcriptional regulator [Paramicrobacterium agarici]|uniref:DNA-binding transcriptional MerR regulator n=1 Tax=Paramicrobacterium agarici TaxID=630514 RepID=A0A2A9E1G5_9MICO|nr:MerR family transcriptional regulator [Microbacterium agarici]PFG32030.1 DNA-binding transcriptional MerR regulator [Microbacterium agarici]